MYGVTRLDTIENECVRGSLGLTNIARKMKEIKLRRFECVKIHIQYIEIGGEGIDQIISRLSLWNKT